MYLQPYKYPHIHMTTPHRDRHTSSPLLLPTLTQQSQQLSRSQGNLLQPPPVSPTSPDSLQLNNTQRSRSLNTLSKQPPALPATSTAASKAHAPSTAKQPPPVIMVEMDGEEQQQGSSLTADSDGSFMSDSDSDFSDDLSSSSASSFLNMSHGANDEPIRLSRTPPPTRGNSLSPTNGPEGKMLPSVSDPNLYKGPTTPKVPPRPRAQEILTRCTTITRKNATKGCLSPTQTEILTR